MSAPHQFARDGDRRGLLLPMDATAPNADSSAKLSRLTLPLEGRAVSFLSNRTLLTERQWRQAILDTLNPARLPAVLIGCEYSATERDEFRRRGFDAWSCDLKPTDGDPRWHIQGDVRDAIRSRRWSLIILHVDCTAMGVCGNKHYGRGKPKHQARLDAIAWSVATWELACDNADHVALENPASVIFPILREQGADVQYIQPWQHGHPEQKKTGLALWNLPRIVPTDDVYEHMMTLPRKERERIFFMSPGADRGHERSRAYPGIARAFADQWAQSLNNAPGNEAERLCLPALVCPFHEEHHDR